MAIINSKRLLLLILGVIMGLSACSTPQSETIPPSSSIEAAYPDDENIPINSDFAVEQGYPVSEGADEPDMFYPHTIEIPLPGKTTGVVAGKLISTDNQQPYLAPGLYLGKYQKPEQEAEGLPKVFIISEETDPQAIQSSDGQFVFSDVEPGEYRLFIWTPMNFLIVDDVVTQESIIVLVKSGEVTDLGSIIIP